jgi:glycosyltransferase involved in cell wall biosynthesis
LEQRLDLVLTIDYRPQYRDVLDTLAQVPVIVWVRDPRPPEVMSLVATLRIPSGPTAPPRGIRSIDCTGLSSLIGTPGSARRPWLLATPAPSLAAWIEGTYGLADMPCAFLPNIVDAVDDEVAKHPAPRAVFLGRLDPIKRPWLLVELARRFPECEFLMLGQPHFSGPGTWHSVSLPPNVVPLGHVDGARKRRCVASAWVLVNTSIHEALPTSFLEALAGGTPLLSCTNQEDVVSRFGIFTGLCGGDGMESLPQFESGLRRLLEDRPLRERLGRQGRSWVARTHNRETFLRAFDELRARAGLQRGSPRGIIRGASRMAAGRAGVGVPGG